MIPRGCGVLADDKSSKTVVSFRSISHKTLAGQKLLTERNPHVFIRKLGRNRLKNFETFCVFSPGNKTATVERSLPNDYVNIVII